MKLISYLEAYKMNINDLNILWLDLFEALTYTKKLKLLNISKDENIREMFLTNSEITVMTVLL